MGDTNVSGAGVSAAAVDGVAVAGAAADGTSVDGAVLPLRRASGLHPEHLRLLAKVARMYHERGLRQPQIAAELHISQSRVSRLLRQAADSGVVRTVVTLPTGVYTDIEEALQARYGLLDAVVVDVGGTSGDVIPALGAATAIYLDETLTGGDTVGVSSWSRTLLAAVDAMRPKSAAVVDVVTQILGGVGDPEVQVQATRLLSRLAELTGARPVFLPTPGLVSTVAVQRAVVQDDAILEVMSTWDRLTLALVGIGSLEPSSLLRRSGNAIAMAEQGELRDLGAVGDVCLRFFDSEGRLIASPFNDRVLGITPEQLLRVTRRVGVAGGERKYSAIRAAVLGRWINVVVTDLQTARRLLAESP